MEVVCNWKIKYILFKIVLFRNSDSSTTQFYFGGNTISYTENISTYTFYNDAVKQHTLIWLQKSLFWSPKPAWYVHCRPAWNECIIWERHVHTVAVVSVVDIASTQQFSFGLVALKAAWQHSALYSPETELSKIRFKIFSPLSLVCTELHCNCLSLKSLRCAVCFKLCCMLAFHCHFFSWKANQCWCFWPAWSYPISFGQFWDLQFQMNWGTPVGADWLHFHRASVACCAWDQLGILAWRQFP